MPPASHHRPRNIYLHDIRPFLPTEQRSQPFAVRRYSGRVVFQSPVLVVNAPVLSYVEPDKPQQMILSYASEQIGNPSRLAGDLADTDFVEEYWIRCKAAYITDCRTEQAVEVVTLTE